METNIKRKSDKPLIVRDETIIKNCDFCGKRISRGYGFKYKGVILKGKFHRLCYDNQL